MKKLLETKLYIRNLIKGINIWVIFLVIYSGPFLKWTREEPKEMNERTRKLMTEHKALHPRDEVDRLYVPRENKEEDPPELKIALTHRYDDSKTT